MFKVIVSASAALCSFGAFAQEAGTLQAVPVSEAPAYFLPANTEVLMSMNQEVTTKGKKWNEGDTFNMSVVHDVVLDGLVVIPRGTRGIGRITWLTDKGMFGKSGKMDVELEYIEVGGRRIDVNGTYRQEGEGNTVATVGGVLLAGPFAAFITGKSGRIPQGRELMAHTESDIPVAMPAGYKSKPAGLTAIAATPPLTVAATTEAGDAETLEREPGLNPDSAAKCDTCR